MEENLSFLSFRTPKQVTIRDWRIGVIHKLLIFIGAMYYLVYRVGYLGDHLDKEDVLTQVNAKADLEKTDSQWTFQPHPPCEAKINPKKRKHPKDIVYELLPGKDLFLSQQHGQFFIPARIWPVARVDTMNRTVSEGYSLGVCTAACEKTNLTLLSSACRDMQTESDCNSSFITQTKGENLKECFWESAAGTCSTSPIIVKCPPPCGLYRCKPCAKFCDFSFVWDCIEELNKSSCSKSYTVDSDDHAMHCKWTEGKCLPNIERRTVCASLKGGQRDICDEPPSMTQSSECHIYEAPIEYNQPLFVQNYSSRYVASIERLVIQYNHILTLDNGAPDMDSMQGYVVPASKNMSDGHFRPHQWEEIPVATCKDSKEASVAHWVRDGRMLRCYRRDRQPRTVDFIPLPALMKAAGKTLDCNDNGEYASPVQGFTLMVTIEYSNKRPWHFWGGGRWWSSMRVEHDSWMGEMSNLPLHNDTSNLAGGENYARGIRVLFRAHGHAYYWSLTKIFSLIPEFFAFNAIVNVVFVWMLVLHNVLTKRFKCGKSWNRLASDWYCRYIFERTPNIVRVMSLVRRVLHRYETIALSSKGISGVAGVELDDAGYITSVSEDGLMFQMLQAWNTDHPVMAIGPGDKILNVNGHTSLEEMKAELISRQAFDVEIEPHVRYPFVLSTEALKRLMGHASQSAFDVTRPNILLPYEIKKQVALFVNFALRECQSDSLRGRKVRKSLTLDNRLHIDDDDPAPLQMNMSTSLSVKAKPRRALEIPSEFPSSPFSPSERLARADEKIVQMEEGMQRLGEQVEDLLAWKASASQHSETIPALQKPSVQDRAELFEPIVANALFGREADGSPRPFEGLEVAGQVEPDIENRLSKLETDVAALWSDRQTWNNHHARSDHFGNEIAALVDRLSYIDEKLSSTSFAQDALKARQDVPIYKVREGVEAKMSPNQLKASGTNHFSIASVSSSRHPPDGHFSVDVMQRDKVRAATAPEADECEMKIVKKKAHDATVHGAGGQGMPESDQHERLLTLVASQQKMMAETEAIMAKSEALMKEALTAERDRREYFLTMAEGQQKMLKKAKAEKDFLMDQLQDRMETSQAATQVHSRPQMYGQTVQETPLTQSIPTENPQNHDRLAIPEREKRDVLHDADSSQSSSASALRPQSHDQPAIWKGEHAFEVTPTERRVPAFNRRRVDDGASFKV